MVSTELCCVELLCYMVSTKLCCVELLCYMVSTEVCCVELLCYVVSTELCCVKMVITVLYRLLKTTTNIEIYNSNKQRVSPFQLMEHHI